MKILISGTPGVGKTTLSKQISENFQLYHLDVSDFIIKNKIYDVYLDNLDTFEFSVKNVQKSINKHLKSYENYIIDTHTPDVVSSIKFDAIFVLKCPIKALKPRLDARNYPEEKITENIDCELFEEVFMQCKEIFGDDEVVCIGDNEIPISKEDALKVALNHLSAIDQICNKKPLVA